MRDRWTLLIAGGCLGSVVGVIGASISDPEVGFPAWVDLTGVVVGFGLGVLLTTGLVALLRHAMWSSRTKHQRKDVHEEELRPFVCENLAAADEIMAKDYIDHAVAPFGSDEPGRVHGRSHTRRTVE